MIDTKQFEGLRLHVYTDTTGHKTIGYGHNLQGGNDTNLCKLGLDPKALEMGDISLTPSQADALFALDMDGAHQSLLHIIPDADTYPSTVIAILNDLVFNMGINTFKTFKNTINAFKQKDWKLAADNLEKSLWYRQVKVRGRTIVAALREIE
jgi:GH24 family phage-related lysozyme (muramidase)